MSQGTFQIEVLRQSLRVRRVGRKLTYLPETSSTNDEAWKQLPETGSDGHVVIADYQSAGRGRLGRTWIAPRGAGLLLSVLLIEQDDDPHGSELCLTAGVALCEADLAVTDVCPIIHWPNDIYVGPRKLAGILVESRRPASPLVSSAAVLGIGVNCLQQSGHFPPELLPRATSLEIESHRSTDRALLATALLHRLDHWLAQPRTWTRNDLRDAWMAHAEPPGCPVTLRHGNRTFRGAIVEIDPLAALVVRLEDGTIRAFPAAETTVLAHTDMS
jgi:BirA family biotin operon repressor/biotin-[acetyl-CoA-carboxylase] ligase